MWAGLSFEGVRVGRKRVARQMRRARIQGVTAAAALPPPGGVPSGYQHRIELGAIVHRNQA